MSQSIIKVDGFVANEPKIRHTQDGTPVLALSVPHQRSVKNEQSGQWENVGPTTWHSVSVFGAQAEALAPLATKGTHVLVEGFAELRTWEQDGKHGAEILVRRAKVGIIPKVQRQEHQPTQAQQWASQPEQADAWAAPGVGYGDETPF